MDSIAIKLTHVSKQYTIHHEKPTLVEKFVTKKNETFSALHNINLVIKKGEKVGIIGPNGSGKTTLLKIIAGITTPTKGSVYTNGRIISLIDLEAGFHPDLSGYQNILINGLLLGMKKKEIEKELLPIINFADIRQFIDTPLYMFSDGMKLRLGFAIATHANPDIFIIDEGIGVGDTQFQQRAERKINSLINKSMTILIVSQYKYIIERYSKKIIIMKKGTITQQGKKILMNKYFTK